MIPPNITTEISNRLSLRAPLRESLELFDRLVREGALPLQDGVAPDLAALACHIREIAPSFSEFGRGFPSLAFNIATGVGKTRLMAAFIVYLFRTRGIRNFFILAPNLTIYNKLIKDFGDPSYEKYVFQGISEFVTNRPVIITGDNYAQAGGLFEQDEVRINVFNIAKFNSDTKTSKKDGRVQQPRIKRISEYLGQSYWAYLSQLNDLVILMDEAHRYHADASKSAIEELRPLLGLELTATPIDEKGNVFRNIIYEYTLGKALDDGQYIKIPAVATRRNYNFDSLNQEETDILKLEDGVSLHEDTKQALLLYARETGLRAVKPFILVACQSLTHAEEVEQYCKSAAFYEGRYSEKVLRIDSSNKSDEAIEQQFLSLESPDNPIEIVIHVSMLKEGWDVTNLYTIVPLRASKAPVLVEQTIGRGLRLPYAGMRTGVEKVDMLTVVGHENFRQIIEAAQSESSLFRKMRMIELEDSDWGQQSELVQARNTMDERIAQKKLAAQTIGEEKDRQAALAACEAEQMVANIIPALGREVAVRRYEDLLKPEIKEMAISLLEGELNKGQGQLFGSMVMEEVKSSYERIVHEFKKNIIEIPRIVVRPKDSKAVFRDFDLDTSEFRFQALEMEIQRVQILELTKADIVKVERNRHYQAPEKTIMAALLDYPEIDHEHTGELLYKLALQAVNALREYGISGDNLRTAAFDYRDAIAKRIYDQMMFHFEVEELTFE
ncbi:MAG: DEAD/DEAH box helicase family protein, partial [Saprospiraceae bacterium]|nr:DEAD/DEAH box helicase family protein [Saprospiraceae bacterium]